MPLSYRRSIFGFSDINTNRASDTIDIMAALKYLQSQAEVSGTAMIGQIDFGREMCSTVGFETFAVSSYSLTGS